MRFKDSAPREPNTVLLGQGQVKQLLVLMDTDQNRKISGKSPVGVRFAATASAAIGVGYHKGGSGLSRSSPL